MFSAPIADASKDLLEEMPNFRQFPRLRGMVCTASARKTRRNRKRWHLGSASAAAMDSPP